VNETYRVSGTIRGLDRTNERTADHKLRRESNCTIIVSRNCRRRAIVYYLNATYVIERRDKTPKTDIAAERIAANRKSYAVLVRVTICVLIDGVRNANGFRLWVPREFRANRSVNRSPI
jgi:hypothetical protein